MTKLTDKEKDDVWIEWYNTRPQIIKDLVDKYPPGWYVVKVGAPYGLTVEGTKVWLESYRESGEVGVIVNPEDKLEEGIIHEQMLGLEFNKTDEELYEIHKSAVKCHVDPVWLELLVKPDFLK